MAFANRANIANRSFTAGGSSWSTTTAVATLSGDLLFAVISCDNTQTTDGESSTVVSIDIGGQALSKFNEYTNGEGAAGAGIACSFWYFQNSAALSGGTSVTVTFDASLAANGAVLRVQAFTMDNTTTLTKNGVAFLVVDASTDPGDLSISGLASSAYLFIRASCFEGTALTASNTTNWTNLTSGNNNTVGVIWEFHINTATGDTSDNLTNFNVGDSASIMLALSEGTAATDVFFENRHNIEGGMKPNTAAGMGGVLIE